MTCTIVALVVTCIGPSIKTTPVEAAALLAPRQYVHVPRSAGPSVLAIAGDPTDGPFGPLILSPPTTRLDGTPLDSQPWMAVAYGWRGTRGYGPRRGTGQRRRP